MERRKFDQRSDLDEEVSQERFHLEASRQAKERGHRIYKNLGRTDHEVNQTRAKFQIG